MDRLHNLEAALESKQALLRQHPIYHELKNLDHFRTFSEGHVYAVWDFMSLLKALQLGLTRTRLPWLPPANPELARFINEIVLGEETDLDADGQVQSHFEMYLSAMEELGADTSRIQRFIEAMKHGNPPVEALEATGVNPGVSAFVKFTFGVIDSGELHRVAAAFTFGREALIPDLFLAILDQAENTGSGTGAKMRYYLNRHIELDGDHHGPLALRMISGLCGSDEERWKAVEETALQALDARIGLWDAILGMIRAKSPAGQPA